MTTRGTEGHAGHATTSPSGASRGTPVGRFGRRLLELCLVGASASWIAALLYRIWDRGLSTPFYRDPDVQIISAIVKTVDRHGWYLHNPDLGAPFSQQFYDFPHGGETLQLAAIRVLGLATDRFGLIINAYYLLGFGILAAVTFAVLRHLDFSRAIAWAVALLYTFLPYHFAHGEGHLFRSTYFSAPLAALLMLWILSYRATFLRSPDAPLWPWRTIRSSVRWPRVWFAVLLCTVVAITETMSVAFTLTALVTACVLLAVRDRSFVQLVAGLLAAGVIAVVFAASLAPNLRHSLEHGSNEVAARRYIHEQEAYGLRISQMVLPDEHHRLRAARDLTQRTNEHSPLSSEQGQALGVLGTVGFLVMIATVLLRGVPRRSRAPVTDRSQLVRHGGLLTLILVLFATASGLAMTLDLLGFTQIRVWNRVVVLIAFWALVTLAVGFERASRWLASRTRWAAPISALVLVALVGFSVWDTTGQLAPSGESRLVGPVKAFGEALERRLPKGASLFQLPVIAFPETPDRYAMRDYDEFLPYLWSDGLRWSYGSIKGRPEADWQELVSSDDPAPALPGLAGLGFSGIVVDTAGYADGGAAVIAKLDEAIGPQTFASPGGRWRFWDLRDYARATGRSEAELRAAARRLVGPLVDELPASR